MENQIRPILAHQGDVKCIAQIELAQGQKWVSSGSRDKSVKIWEVIGEKMELRFCLTEHNSFVNSACFCMFESRLLHYSGDAGGNLFIVDVLDQTITKYIVAAHSDNICALKSCSTYVLSSSWDGYVKKWRGTDLLEQFKVSDVAVWTSITWADDCIISGTADGRIKVITGSKIARQFANHNASIRSLCIIDQDGVDFASSGNDGVLSFWSLSRGHLFSHQIHGTFVYDICRIPGKNIICSCGEDGLCKFWEFCADGCKLLSTHVFPMESLWAVICEQRSLYLASSSGNIWAIPVDSYQNSVVQFDQNRLFTDQHFSFYLDHVFENSSAVVPGILCIFQLFDDAYIVKLGLENQWIKLGTIPRSSLTRALKVEVGQGQVLDLIFQPEENRDSVIDRFLIENGLSYEFKNDIEKFVKANLGADFSHAHWRTFASINLDGALGKLSSFGVDTQNIKRAIEAHTVVDLEQLYDLDHSLHFVALDILRYLCSLSSDMVHHLYAQNPKRGCKCLNYVLEKFSFEPKAAKMKIRLIVNLFLWPTGQAILISEFPFFWKLAHNCYQLSPDLCKEELDYFIHKYDILYIDDMFSCSILGTKIPVAKVYCNSK